MSLRNLAVVLVAFLGVASACSEGPRSARADSTAVATDSVPDREKPFRIADAEIPSVPSEPPAARIAREHDRFRQQTIYNFEELPLAGGLRMGGYFVVADTATEAPGVVALRFISSSASWRYLDCHTLDLLADGQPVPDVDKIEHDGTVGSGYVLEQMSLILPVRTFLRLAAAKTVEGRLCRTEFALRDTHLRTLTALASQLGSHRDSSRLSAAEKTTVIAAAPPAKASETSPTTAPSASTPRGDLVLEVPGSSLRIDAYMQGVRFLHVRDAVANSVRLTAAEAGLLAEQSLDSVVAARGPGRTATQFGEGTVAIWIEREPLNPERPYRVVTRESGGYPISISFSEGELRRIAAYIRRLNSRGNP